MTTTEGSSGAAAPAEASVKTCQHLRVTGKWALFNGIDNAFPSTLGAFVYRCDDCGEPWTGGTYMTQPVRAISLEEQEDQAWKRHCRDHAYTDADESVFRAGFRARGGT